MLDRNYVKNELATYQNIPQQDLVSESSYPSYEASQPDSSTDLRDSGFKLADSLFDLSKSSVLFKSALTEVTIEALRPHLEKATKLGLKVAGIAYDYKKKIVKIILDVANTISGQLDALNMDNDISSDGSYDSDNEEFSISDDVITYQYNLIPQSVPSHEDSGAAVVGVGPSQYPIYVPQYQVPVYVPTAVPQYKDNTKEAPTTTQHEHEATIKEVVDPGKTYGSLQINLDKVDAFSDDLKYVDEFDIDSVINEIYLLHSSEKLDDHDLGESYTINTGNEIISVGPVRQHKEMSTNVEEFLAYENNQKSDSDRTKKSKEIVWENKSDNSVSWMKQTYGYGQNN